jgi:hypothetical protein
MLLSVNHITYIVYVHFVELHVVELNGVEHHVVELHGVELHGAELHVVELHGVELNVVELHGVEPGAVELRTLYLAFHQSRWRVIGLMHSILTISNRTIRLGLNQLPSGSEKAPMTIALSHLSIMTRDRCFLNIFAEKFSGKNGVFDSKQS